MTGQTTAPLTVSQRQLYAMVSRFPEVNRGYNACEAIRIHGSVDLDALAVSIDQVVARHEALRTTLVRTGAAVEQMVLPATGDTLRICDAGPVEAAIEAECDALFRLHGDPLARFTLYRRAADEYVLLAVVHHLMVDGWSLEVMWREIGELYSAIRRGVPCGLPPVALQFAEYARAQPAWLAGDRARRMMDYWLTELDGGADGTTVPYDLAVAALGRSGRRQELALPADLAGQVFGFARTHRVSAAATLLFAWQLLLGRRAAAPRIAVGVPMANRNHATTHGSIGYFVNTHAVCLDIADGSMSELLAASARRLVAAMVHQELPLPAVIEQARRTRGAKLPARPYRTMFGYQDSPSAPPDFADLRAEHHPLVTRTGKADMTLYARRDGTALTCELEYTTDLYRETTAAAVLAEYADTLARLVSERNGRVRAAEQEREVAEKERSRAGAHIPL